MQPMLASKFNDYFSGYPLLVSTKLDGIRCLVYNGAAYSRTMKLIPSSAVQRMAAKIKVPVGTFLDCEIIAGKNDASGTFRPYDFNEVSSSVMSKTVSSSDTVFKFYAFDLVSDSNLSQPYIQRYAALKNFSLCCGYANLIVVTQYEVNSDREVMQMFDEFLKAGYEGAMVRSPKAPYKFGRATEREGYLMKLKEFRDSEAEIIGYQCMLSNQNETYTNEVGATKRSTHAAGMVEQDTLGKLIVRDINTLVQFEIGTGKGLTAELRKKMWKDRVSLIGKIITYEFQEYGQLKKPRLPRFKGFRFMEDIGGDTNEG